MKKPCPWLSPFTWILFLAFGTGLQAQAPEINWQYCIGTEHSDEASLLFTDESGNIVVIGQETHVDITGWGRHYLIICKYDQAAQQLYKVYHDIPLETGSPLLGYYLYEHFYSEIDGQSIINITLKLHDRIMLYQLMDSDGSFYSYQDIPDLVYHVSYDNFKTSARQQCSYSAACYGPDSLIVENLDPAPIFGEPTKSWTYTDKQHIRTTPIQGHYDYNNQDIARDEEGNVYLLTQIERYDFQFCTDCNDVFVDAHSEIFKFDTAGQLVKHFKIKTAKAIISNMKFVRLANGEIIVKIDDINAQGNKVLSSIYYLDYELGLKSQFTMDRQYYLAKADAQGNIYASDFVHDPDNPETHGFADCMLAHYSASGALIWETYLGGSGYDYPRGIALCPDGGIAMLSTTGSDDFDVEGSHGEQDIWLVKLGGSITAGLEDVQAGALHLYPNPAGDQVWIEGLEADTEVRIYDLGGKEQLRKRLDARGSLDLGALPQGYYVLRAEGRSLAAKLIKLK